MTQKLKGPNTPDSRSRCMSALSTPCWLEKNVLRSSSNSRRSACFWPSAPPPGAAAPPPDASLDCSSASALARSRIFCCRCCCLQRVCRCCRCRDEDERGEGGRRAWHTQCLERPTHQTHASTGSSRSSQPCATPLPHKQLATQACAPPARRRARTICSVMTPSSSGLRAVPSLATRRCISSVTAACSASGDSGPAAAAAALAAATSCRCGV